MVGIDRPLGAVVSTALISTRGLREGSRVFPVPCQFCCRGSPGRVSARRAGRCGRPLLHATTNGDMTRTAPSAKIPPMATVAIVEDDAKTSRLLADLLAEAGFAAGPVCADAETARMLLVGARPDIVLMDIDLPGASGIECVRRLKPHLPRTQFVMITVYEDAENIYDALAAGAVGYLLKRAVATELAPALHDVLAGGSPMTSSVARKVVHSFQPTHHGVAEIEQLSERERQVLQLMAQGRLYKEIADMLGVSENTVRSYIRRIYEKLHVRSRMEAVAKLQPR